MLKDEDVGDPFSSGAREILPPEEVALEPVACPLCSESGFTVVALAPDRLSGLPGEFRVVQCNRCRHRYTNPRPTIDSAAACYPAGYTPHLSARSPDSSAPVATSPRPTWLRIARWIPGLQGLYRWLSDTGSNWQPPLPRTRAVALDVGCATGTFLLRLRELGWNVTGVEPSSTAVLAARSAGLPVHEGTLESAAFPDTRFDAVFAWMVLEHVPDPRATLAELRRIVRTDGWLIFSVPNAGSCERCLFGKYWVDYDLPRHFQHFTLPVLERLLRETGFRIERVRYQSHGNSLLGSFGAWAQETRLLRPVGRKCVHWFWNNPPFWVALTLAWPAKLLAACRMSGRMTVIARPVSQGPDAAQSTDAET